MVVVAAVLALATSCYRDFDFTLDNRADYAYVDADGDWWDATTGVLLLDAEPGDLAVPGDWDGDHVWDRAVVRPDGDWVTSSTLGTISFPAPAQIPSWPEADGSTIFILPVPGDYDGDGHLEPAWYRDSDATWFIEGQDPVAFGSGPTRPQTGSTALDEVDQDFPVPADYDGDGMTDLAAYSPRTRAWTVRSSVDGSVTTVVMRRAGGYPHYPAPADYDGDGRADRAIVNGTFWDIEGRELIPHGQEKPLPAVADYDGDGRADLSTVDDHGRWVTMGSVDVVSIDTGLRPHFHEDGTFALPTTRNLAANIARLHFVSYACDDVDLDLCNW